MTTTERVDLKREFLVPIKTIMSSLPNAADLKWSFDKSSELNEGFDVSGTDEELITKYFEQRAAVSSQELLKLDFKKTQLISGVLTAKSPDGAEVVSLEYVDSSFVLVRSSNPGIANKISSILRRSQQQN